MTRITRFLHRARRYPATLVITLLLAGLGITALATGSRGPFTLESAGLDAAGLGARHWWVVLSSVVPVGGLLQLIVTLVATVIGLGLAERAMGTRRVVVAFVVTGVVASLVGIGLQTLGTQLGESWSRAVSETDTVDPLTPVAGALAWASAWLGQLWRRRVRTVLVGGGAALLLYSGQPADLYLLLAVVLGLVAGRLRHPVVRAPRGARETRSMLSIVAAILAVGPVLTVVSATRYGLLSPLGVALLGGAPRGTAVCRAQDVGAACIEGLTHHRLTTPGGLLVALLPLVLLLVGARGLAAGRRAALVLVIVVSLLNSVAAAWYLGVLPVVGGPFATGVRAGHEWELALSLIVSTLIPLAFAVVLFVFRRLFPLHTSAARARMGGAVGGIGAAVVLAVVVAVAVLHPQGFTPAPRPLTVLLSIVDRLTPAPFLRHAIAPLRGTDPIGEVTLAVVGPLLWLVVLAAALVVLGGRRVEAATAEAPGIDGLLAGGSGTLGHMATWPGVRLWTAPDGAAGVAYRLVDGAAITVGDPVGRVADPDALLDGFLRFCDTTAWQPVFYSVHAEWERRLRSRGWSSLVVAEEAVIDPATFQLAGKAMQEVRTSVNRADRLGLHAEWLVGDRLPRRRMDQLMELSDEWMAGRDLPELGFTLGGLDELEDPDVEVGLVVDEEDRILAVTSWLPVRRDGALVGRTLDVMRRRRDAPNGTMEFLIADAVARAREAGLELVSLSGSPLARSETTTPGPLDRVLGSLGGALEPVYGFRSLMRFKAKFKPALRPMYLVVRDPLALPTIGVAIARAYLPGAGLREARAVLSAR
ncbi:bifunctional lysylphosphatidylglycerol flippase/synthetase MprF [Pseudolysinimonas sp.]|uniref:bifunctional lysylphosphatidylglycerol flippase/synthetase MprF n=1 Tax=Pseudolysinimonas sp. TaxID=2680009 RepID=UPI003F7D1621